MKPSDVAHQAMRRAQREHKKAWGRVDRAFEEVAYIFERWSREYGMDDPLAARMTDLTISNITEEE